MSPEVNVVVGGGQAGAVAAQAMRSAGFAGRIVLVGEEKHLPYERPPLSKELLTNAGSAKRPDLFDAAFYAENAIDLRLGTVVDFVDRQAQRVVGNDGLEIAYDRLLLATGSQLRRLPVAGSERT